MAASVVKVKWFLNKAASWKGKKLAMKMFVSALKKKKDPTEEEKIMTEMVAKSYDISDEKYLEPVIDYLT